MTTDPLDRRQELQLTDMVQDGPSCLGVGQSEGGAGPGQVSVCLPVCVRLSLLLSPCFYGHIEISD